MLKGFLLSSTDATAIVHGPHIVRNYMTQTQTYGGIRSQVQCLPVPGHHKICKHDSTSGGFSVHCFANFRPITG